MAQQGLKVQPGRWGLLAPRDFRARLARLVQWDRRGQSVRKAIKDCKGQQVPRGPRALKDQLGNPGSCTGAFGPRASLILQTVSSNMKGAPISALWTSRILEIRDLRQA